MVKEWLAFMIAASILLNIFAVPALADVDMSDPAKVLINEGFSDYKEGDSIVEKSNGEWTSSGAITSFNAVSRGAGDIAAEFNTVGQTADGNIIRKFASSAAAITGEVEISFDYKVDSSKARGVQLNIQPNSGHGICLDLGLNLISHHNGTASETIFSSLTKDEWYHVIIRAYTAKRQFDMTLIGPNNVTQKKEGLTSRGDMSSGLTKFLLAGKRGDAIVLLDNFLVGPYKEDEGGGDGPDPEPQPPEVEAAFTEHFESDTAGEASALWNKNAALSSDDLGYVKGAEGPDGICTEISLTKGATTSAVTYNLPNNTAQLLYGNVYASFDFMIDPSSVYGVMLVFFDTSNKHGIALTFDADGSIIADQREIYPVQTLKTIAGNIENGRWYNMALDVNTFTKTYSVYIDGVLAMENVGFRTNASQNFKKLTVSAYDTYGDGNRKFYIDNLVIKNRSDGFMIGRPKLFSRGEEIIAVHAGDTVNASLDIIEYNPALRKELMLLLAQYDESGALIGLAAGREIYGEDNIITLKTQNYTVKECGSVRLKVFLWNKDTLVPVTGLLSRDEYKYTDRYSVYLISDSITANYTPNYAPQVGLGMLYENIFDKNVIIKNYAKPSRSTKSFIDEGRFELVMRELKQGDVLFVQMGHNDKGLSVSIDNYKANLVKFIDGARARGAFPVLITPPSALTTTLTSSLAGYPAAMIEVGKSTNTPVIDLHSKSLELYNKTGVLADDYQYAKDTFFLFDIDPEIASVHPNAHIRDGSGDGTHLRDVGADMMIKFIAEEIVRLDLPFAEDVIIPE